METIKNQHLMFFSSLKRKSQRKMKEFLDYGKSLFTIIRNRGAFPSIRFKSPVNYY